MTRFPQSKSAIPTPALLVDLDRLESNLKRLADHCRAAGVAFRPHAKTHKCPELARRQIAAGAVGISAATVPEVEALARAGIPGVLLTSPLVEPAKVARLVELVRGGSDLLIAVGHALEVELIAAATARFAARTIRVLIDLDVGDRRTGVLPGKSALALAQEIGRHQQLHLCGLQAYAGHASHVVSFGEREQKSRQALAHAVDTKERLARVGFDMSILSCASTGTYNIDSTIPGVTELQCGSFVFMDLDYRRIGGQGNAEAFGDFQLSLTVLTSVISATHAERVTVDAGIKAFSTDTPFKPEARDRPGLILTRTGDEFGILSAEDGQPLPELGARIEFYVPHCDPTVHLYDRLYAVRGAEVEAVWPILARRETISPRLPRGRGVRGEG